MTEMIEEIKKRYDDVDSLSIDAQTPSTCIFNYGKQTPIPKYTIAIPTYKRADLLKLAVDSALCQEQIDNYEILVVDNNPERNDETELVMEQYRNMPHVAYYKNSANLGMAGNWNKLYLLSRSEWVVMLHDDDMLYPDFLSVLQQVIEIEPKAACFYACYNSINNNSSNQPLRNERTTQIVTLREKDYLTGCHVHAPLGMTIKREVVFQMGGFNHDFYPSLDYHFHVKLAHYYPVRWLRGYPVATYRKLVNASGKEETLFGWLVKDNDIKRLIRKNNWVPLGCLQNIYLKCANYLFKKNWYQSSEHLESPSIFHWAVYYLLKLLWGLPKKIRSSKTLHHAHAE